jgi:hypothetical protein
VGEHVAKGANLALGVVRRPQEGFALGGGQVFALATLVVEAAIRRSFHRLEQISWHACQSGRMRLKGKRIA